MNQQGNRRSSGDGRYHAGRGDTDRYRRRDPQPRGRRPSLPPQGRPGSSITRGDAYIPRTSTRPRPSAGQYSQYNDTRLRQDGGQYSRSDDTRPPTDGGQYSRNDDTYPRQDGGRYTRQAAGATKGSDLSGQLFTVISVALLLIVVTGVALVKLTDFCGSGSGGAGAVVSPSEELPPPPPTEAELRLARAEELLAGMTAEQKVGQLLLLRSHDIGESGFCKEIEELQAGGIVLFANDIKGKDAAELTAMIERYQLAGGGSLLVCVDEEGGTVVRVSSNRKLRSESFRSPQKLFAEGGMELIGQDAAEKSRFLRQYGINVNFAPVADVVTERGGMMYKRAFGAGAAETAEYVRTVVSAMSAEGMGACVKHFPGYGNTSGDTHDDVVKLDTPLEALRENDLIPFAAGIEAGCGAVMITHTVMTAIDPNAPASMSPAVIELLRGELGFTGVTISDGMDMGAIRKYASGRDVCVAAFLAGVDMMCTPGDGRKTFDALLGAVKDGTITAEALDAAVTRILCWKLELGLYPMQAEASPTDAVETQ